MKRRRFAGALALIAALLCAVFVAPAFAQSDEDLLSIRGVDGTNPDAVEVTFVYRGNRADLSSLSIREEGEQVQSTPALPLTDAARLAVVLLIDVSGSMEENSAIVRAKEAAAAYVDGKTASERVAVVTFGGDVNILQEFTTDKAALTTAINGIVIQQGGTKLYDALQRAAALFEDEPNAQPNILLLSDGDDANSVTTRERAESALLSSKAAVYSLALVGSRFNPGELRDFSEKTGGQFLQTENASEIGKLFDTIQQTLARQYVVSFASAVEPGSGTAEIELTVRGQQQEASYTPGADAQGAANVRVVPVSEPSGPSFLRSSVGFLLALLLAALAAAGLVWALATTFSNEGTLDAALSPYADGYVATTGDDGDDPRRGVSQTQFLQRAVQLTSDIAERQGILTKLESQLERANLPLRAAEALFFYVAGVFIVTLLSLVISRNLIAGLIFFLIVALVPIGVLNFLAGRRAKQFESMLPDTLQLLSSTLRAGYSLMQGVEAVSQETAEPMGRELRRVVTEARLGRPLETALDGVAERMQSGDFAWAVMAIRIQREVGGNLSELLMTVAETMTQRERLRRDVNALTAEGRISAIILGLLPVGLGFMMYAINPAYMELLFEETMGNVMLIAALIMAGIGFWWMKKTIDIDI